MANQRFINSRVSSNVRDLNLNSKNHPIILIATYQLEQRVDGTEVALCFTSADTFWSAFFFVGSITLFFLLPFGVLLVLYVAIAYKLLRRNSAFYRPTTPPFMGAQKLRKLHNGTCRHRKQVILMLAAVVSSFFVCLLPFRAFTLWIIASTPEDLAALSMEGYYNILYFCRFMLYLNSALNPILYNLMSSKFRAGFWRLFVSCCRQQERVGCQRDTTRQRRSESTSISKWHGAVKKDRTSWMNSFSISTSSTERTNNTNVVHH